MIVVSDTTPLHYLILIDEVDLLPGILGEIVIPVTVFQELQAAKTPAKIKEFIASVPSWLTVKESTGIYDDELFEIDAGEREAILLAEQLAADAILIDDRAGRETAERRGHLVIGTLGVIEIAAEDGLLDFAKTLDRIKRAGFFVSPSLERDFLRKQGLL